MQVLSIDLTRRIVRLDVGEAPITHMLDWEGDETNDFVQAVIVIAHMPNGQWAWIDVLRFGLPTIH